ncbi:MAG: nucleotide exchange factor GrpE [Ruminococcus flavefaciens]|nr:nucleotide exchange factor GrpE [Ruminococcus flavefaciens]MCM1228767.1 nucleotide exchange factor GrpE [Ruminococcus flavefaciens]
MKKKNCSEEIPEKEVAEEVTEELQESESADEEDAVSEYNDTAAQFAEMEEELAKVKDELARAREDYIRLFAEYDNYRKRTVKEKADTYANASAKCIENLLPVADSFERSLEAECSDENFKNGLNMILNQLKDFFNKMNVTELDAMGKEFDPNFHNAIQQLDGTDYASNHVCAVYQKGYLMGDKLIRPAMVAVAV